DLFHQVAIDSNDPVNVKRVTSNWQQETTTYINQPSNGTTVYDSSKTAAGVWATWQLGKLYQKVLDTTWVDHGIRLGSVNYNEFASANFHDSSIPPPPNLNWADPQLVLSFNDLPNATTNASP